MSGTSNETVLSIPIQLTNGVKEDRTESRISAPAGTRIVRWDRIKFNKPTTGSVAFSLEVRKGDTKEVVKTAALEEVTAKAGVTAGPYSGGIDLAGKIKHDFDKFLETHNDQYTIYLIAKYAPIKHSFSFKENINVNFDAELNVYTAPLSSVNAQSVTTSSSSSSSSFTIPSSDSGNTNTHTIIAVEKDAIAEEGANVDIKANLMSIKKEVTFEERITALKKLMDSGKLHIIAVKGNFVGKKNSTTNIEATAFSNSTENAEKLEELKKLAALCTEHGMEEEARALIREGLQKYGPQSLTSGNPSSFFAPQNNNYNPSSSSSSGSSSPAPAATSNTGPK